LLLHSVTYDKVNDLRSDFAQEMLRSLQQKMARFGVEVSGVKITDVQLPNELQKRLEKTTSFATRIGGKVTDDSCCRRCGIAGRCLHENRRFSGALHPPPYSPIFLTIVQSRRRTRRS
jgi:hypothetical protein